MGLWKTTSASLGMSTHWQAGTASFPLHSVYLLLQNREEHHPYIHPLLYRRKTSHLSLPRTDPWGCFCSLAMQEGQICPNRLKWAPVDPLWGPFQPKPLYDSVMLTSRVSCWLFSLVLISYNQCFCLFIYCGQPPVIKKSYQCIFDRSCPKCTSFIENNLALIQH